MSEKKIESYLRQRVKELGGKAYKFVSPGNKGVPDRLIGLPGNRIIFTGIKSPGEIPTKLQRYKHREMRALGMIVFGCVDTKEKVDRLIGALSGTQLNQILASGCLDDLEVKDR